LFINLFLFRLTYARRLLGHTSITTIQRFKHFDKKELAGDYDGNFRKSGILALET